MQRISSAPDYEAFDTSSYYHDYRAHLDSVSGGSEIMKFVLDSFHEVFDSGSISGECLLDVGTGVSLLSFLSASRHVKQIYLSDMLPKHIDLLQKWLDGTDLENELVEYILKKENDGTTLTKRLADLRRKVKELKVFDVTKKLELDDTKMKYDIITSAFCLEVSVRSVDAYESVVCSIARLVKPGGYIVLAGTLEETHYNVGKYKFWNANIREEDVKSAFKKARLNILIWKDMSEPSELKEMAPFKRMFVTAAQKL